MKINDLIKKYRKRKDYTLKDLADKLGISFSTIGMWERGQSEPSIYYYDKLKEIFGDDYIEELNVIENKTNTVEEPTGIYNKTDDGIGALYRSMEKLVETNAELVKMLQEQMGKK